ncbi:hypothetical protein GJ496_006895 [Pomphorhynchus laevis]|nr:hypothetical protein GJ496_006895 [Pomphorhynchus laevis]
MTLQLSQLIEEKFICCLMHLRTAFYVINLLALTYPGANKLQHYKWGCYLSTSNNIWFPCYLDCLYQIPNSPRPGDQAEQATAENQQSQNSFRDRYLDKLKSSRSATTDSSIKYDGVMSKRLMINDRNAIKYLNDPNAAASNDDVGTTLIATKTIRFLLTEEQRAISDFKNVMELYSHDIFAAWQCDSETRHAEFSCKCKKNEYLPGLAQPSNCQILLNKVDMSYFVSSDRCRTITTSTVESTQSDKEIKTRASSNFTQFKVNSLYKTISYEFEDEFDWASIYDLITRYLSSVEYLKCKRKLEKQKFNSPAVFQNMENFLMTCALLNSMEPDEVSMRFVYSLFDDLDFTPFTTKLEELRDSWSSKYPLI